MIDSLRNTRRLLFAAGLAAAAVVIPAATVVSGGTAEPSPPPMAEPCVLIAVPNAVVPACGPGMRGGSVSAGAPSQELITLKNLCNLYIGGCSAAFYYPPGPVARPDVRVGNSR